MPSEARADPSRCIRHYARVIRDATLEDADAIAALAHARRLDYESAQPRFWRQAADAVEKHTHFVSTLIQDDRVVSLVATDDDERLVGYVFASLVPAPPVYDPGGLTGYIDDFAVMRPALWSTTGSALLIEAKSKVLARGAAQIVVVTGQHDGPKREALLNAGMTVASEWLVQSLRD